jgi:acyl phosphate:glycerol-3-phosphate acyltransferase
MPVGDAGISVSLCGAVPARRKQPRVGYNRASPTATTGGPTMADLLLPALLITAGYLLGSISAAIVICRVLGRPDPRSGGSRNPGATNVMRLAGRDAAAITLAGDMLKGVLPVVAARMVSDDPVIWMLTGFAAFSGHLFPLYFGFRGGKGVATALGVLLALSPIAGLLTIATWLLTFAIARISSVSALVSFLLAPLWVVLVVPSLIVTALVGLMSGLLFWRHRENVSRLLQRREG